jgi:hypothetical protein
MQVGDLMPGESRELPLSFYSETRFRVVLRYSDLHTDLHDIRTVMFPSRDNLSAERGVDRMAVDPRLELAMGMLTAVTNDDREGFLTITDEFEGGCAEALGALGRVAQLVVKMYAADSGVTTNEALNRIAIVIANQP